MHDKYEVSLRAIMKNKKGEFLLLTPRPESSLGGSFDFAGGRIEVSEFEVPLEKALKREIREELGNIKYKLSNKPVALGKHKGSIDGTHILFVFFEAKYISGKIKLSNEHIAYDWVDISKINIKKSFKSGNLEGIKMYLGK
ncbi:MAG: NUDIX domain-containing protein [Candidatus Uhrbacteria bacterium]|nr:NUDIX domain-containing protein [Candidatus Uhrbacteria bacterium]